MNKRTVEASWFPPHTHTHTHKNLALPNVCCILSLLSLQGIIPFPLQISLTIKNNSLAYIFKPFYFCV